MFWMSAGHDFYYLDMNYYDSQTYHERLSQAKQHEEKRRKEKEKKRGKQSKTIKTPQTKDNTNQTHNNKNKNNLFQTQKFTKKLKLIRFIGTKKHHKIKV